MKNIVEITYRFFPYNDEKPQVSIKKVTEENSNFYSCNSSLFPKEFINIPYQVNKDIYSCYFISEKRTIKEICDDETFKKAMNNIKEYISKQYDNIFKQISTYENAYNSYLNGLK